jgi:hypothetical protein
MLFDFPIDSGLLGDVLIVLLNRLLHGEDLPFFTLEFFEKDA